MHLTPKVFQFSMLSQSKEFQNYQWEEAIFEPAIKAVYSQLTRQMKELILKGDQGALFDIINAANFLDIQATVDCGTMRPYGRI